MPVIFMSRIYTPEEPYPVACITLASGLNNHQNILFQTRFDSKGLYSYSKNPGVPNLTDEDEATLVLEEQVDVNGQPLNKGPCDVKLDWVIKNLSVSLFRDWSISEARVVLTANIQNNRDPLPPLPNCFETRGGTNPYLTIEDEIRIYMGYVDSPTTLITPDMLDEVPIEMHEFEQGAKKTDIVKTPIPGFQQPDFERGKLIPVFWGFIDKIDFDGSNRGSGNQLILSCRDRGRVLSDTTLINVPSLAGVFKGGDINTQPSGALWEVASNVAQAVNGYQINIDNSANANNLCWKRIITPKASTKTQGLSQLETRELATVEKQVEFYSAYEINNDPNNRISSEASKVTQDPSLFVRRASFKLMDYQSRPRFHMWLSRPPVAKKNGTSQWQILDKTPISIIKWIAANEEKPLDFFTSHVNGDFCLVPRVLDVSGFSDENRMFRTYFYRSWPSINPLTKDPIDPPCENQLILNIRTFTTVVATANRITIVDNSSMAGNGVAVLKGVKLTIDSIPFSLSERTIKPPCRLKLVYDGNLATYQNASGGALIVAMAYAAQFSRDVSGCEFSVLGDPTFYPGEAVRVYNTYLHDNFHKTQTGLFRDILTKQLQFDEFAERYGSEEAPSAYKEDTQRITQADEASSDIVEKQRSIGTQDTDKDNLILPVYKIRSIEHKLSTSGAKAGFITTILGAMDTNN